MYKIMGIFNLALLSLFSATAQAQEAVSGSKVVASFTTGWVGDFITIALACLTVLKLIGTWSKIFGGSEDSMSSIIQVIAWIALTLWWKNIIDILLGAVS